MTQYNITQNRMTAGRAIISALALWLAFSGVAAADQLYVNESGWWREGDAFNANVTPIQAAVDAADAGGVIYVYGGNYYENVNVDGQLTLEGEGADVVTVTAADPGDHVFEVSADYVNISGFTVTGAQWQMGIFPSGIYLGSGTDHCNISNNNASNNCYAIHLHNSNSNILFNNAISNNYYGIYLQESGSNTLANNSCSTSYHGINILDSGNNTLTNNTADSNAEDGVRLEASSNNTLSDNTIIDLLPINVHLHQKSLN